MPQQAAPGSSASVPPTLQKEREREERDDDHEIFLQGTNPYPTGIMGILTQKCRPGVFFFLSSLPEGNVMKMSRDV